MNKPESIPLSLLIPDRKNANKGTARGGGALETSLRTYGAGRSILVDKNNQIIAGNKTAEAAASIGLENAIVVDTDGSQVVVVRRSDLEIDSTHGRGLAIADNRIAELNLAWDGQALDEILSEGADLSFLFTDSELDDLIDRSENLQLDGTEDEVPEAPAEPVTKAGDLWLMGDHRLLCGDSHDENDLAKLLNGKLVDMVFTDPPYAIYGSSTGLEADVADDKMVMPFFRQTFAAISKACKNFAHIYVTCDWRSWASWWQSLKNAPNIKCKNMIVWSKGKGVGAMYGNAHELIMFCDKTPKKKAMTKAQSGARTVPMEPNVWAISTAAAGEREQGGSHNAQKPVELIQKAIKNSSDKGDIIADFFMGSGSTLAAAEIAGRRCYGMEIDPKYCDVIVERWQNLTGGTAERIACKK